MRITALEAMRCPVLKVSTISLYLTGLPKSALRHLLNNHTANLLYSITIYLSYYNSMLAVLNSQPCSKITQMLTIYIRRTRMPCSDFQGHIDQRTSMCSTNSEPNIQANAAFRINEDSI